MPTGSPRQSESENKGGGGDIELVFVEPLPPEYECPVCQQVLRYPVQFDKCAHHCCSSCLPELIRCPGFFHCFLKKSYALQNSCPEGPIMYGYSERARTFILHKSVLAGGAAAYIRKIIALVKTTFKLSAHFLAYIWGNFR